MWFNQYPYINVNDLNLDYLLKSIKELRYDLENFVNINTIKYANPIQWNITKQYEANTVVIDANDGTAYLSVKPVPSGVALTNTDYWTPIFTLNLLSANQNITLRDDGANVLATFASVAGDWLIWNNILYKVSQNINVNEAYVVGYNLDRFSVELFIKEYINNVISMIGDLSDLTTTDKDSAVDAINEIKGDANAIIASLGEHINADVTLNPSETISNKKVYSDVGATITTQELSVSGDTKFNDVNIFGTVNPAIYVNETFELEHCNVNTDTSISIGVDVNGASVDGVKVAHNKLEALNYPMLTNDASGKDVLIDGNSINSRNSDGVEINEPNGVLTGVRIVNNHITCNPSGTGDCLGIGVARGNVLIASGNVIESAKRDGLHIENDSQDIIVNNNIFTDCRRYGANVANEYRSTGFYATHKINNNIFKSSTYGEAGINLAFSAYSSVFCVDVSNNLVEGFDYGLQLKGLRNEHQTIICDNTIIRKCNKGLITGRNISGKIIFDEVSGYLIETHNNVDVAIDGIECISPISPDNLVNPNTTAPVTIKRIIYPTITPATSGVTLSVPIMKIGRLVKGKILVTFSNPATSTRIKHLLDVDTTSGTPVSATSIYNYGAIGVTYAISGGYLVANSSTHPTGDLEFNIDFDGLYVV